MVWSSLVPQSHHHHRRSISESRNYFIEIDPSLNNPNNPYPNVDSQSNNSNSSSTSEIKGEQETFIDNNYGKRHRKPYANRLVRKSGGVNVKVANVEDKGERYVGDFFTTLVDIRWRWTLAYFTISYVLSWFVFAIIWWVILRAHGDMDHFEEDGWKPCVVGVQSFTSIFLFSLETQHTIGYGYHRMSDECPEAVIMLVIQSIVGVIVESLTVGVFVVKLSRSKKRAQTVVFSKFAVICKKENGLVLMFRVADVGKSKLLEAHIRAQIITKQISKLGKVLLTQQAINLEADDQDEDRLLLFWPTTIIHEIDDESPLFKMKPDNFSKSCDNEFELVIVLEGIVESTGMTTQARTSYLPSEILWGHQFLNLLHQGTKYTANMELFHTTFPISEMGVQSAQELKEEEEELEDENETHHAHSS